MTDGRILVAGAGGFIAGHLVKRLEAEGREVYGVDIKPFGEWWQPGTYRGCMDLSRADDCDAAVDGCSTVVNLACDMGGMGFIALNKAACMLNILINTHLLMAAKREGVGRYFFASSACVYRQDRQDGSVLNYALREKDAYPADPEDGYGWEKLTSERMCRHFREDYGLETRVARFHTVYGPHETWQGGREKVPAAFCRKVAVAKLTGGREVEVWGDGTQRRSFLYVDDLVDGVLRLIDSDRAEPTNIGATGSVTIEELLALVESIAGVPTLKRVYDPTKPLGVRERDCDGTAMAEATGWQPTISLEAGMERTYSWVEDQVRAAI